MKTPRAMGVARGVWLYGLWLVRGLGGCGRELDLEEDSWPIEW